MNTSINTYNNKQKPSIRKMFHLLPVTIDACLPTAERKIWHGSPVWFIDNNPIVGYSKLKNYVSLLFWSGQSFHTPGLIPKGSPKFKAAEARFTSIEEINVKKIRRWLAESTSIQWDYKNIIKRRGRLVRISSSERVTKNPRPKRTHP